MKTYYLCGLVLALASFANGADLLAGAAEVDITPPSGAPMAGYYQNRAATGVLDPLYAKAIVLQIGTTKIAMVACDVANLPRAIVEQARKIAQANTGIAASQIMISATHSHTGPVIYTLPSRYNLQGEMKRLATDYTAALPARIAEAVSAASAKLRPAILRHAVGREDSLPFNRRYFMQDGSVAWNPGKLNPKVVRPAGPVDSLVHLSVIEATDGTAIAAYINYSMHPDTTGGMAFSADYPGVLSRVLRMAKGQQLITLFAMGTAGNVNNIDVHRKERQSDPQEASRIGTVLAGEVLKCWKKAEVVPVDSILTSTEFVALPLAEMKPGDLEWAQRASETFGTANAAPFLDLVKAARIMEVANQKGQPWQAEVQVFAVNKTIAFVAFPAEVFVEFGLGIKNDSPFPDTSIVTLGNGALGYLPNRKAFREGAYEVVSSRCAPGAGELLQDTALRLLQELAARASR